MTAIWSSSSYVEGLCGTLYEGSANHRYDGAVIKAMNLDQGRRGDYMTIVRPGEERSTRTQHEVTEVPRFWNSLFEYIHVSLSIFDPRDIESLMFYAMNYMI